MSPPPDRLSALKLVRTAIQIVDEHWKRPGQPGTPENCPGCAGPDCELLDAAELFLARLRNRVIR